MSDMGDTLNQQSSVTKRRLLLFEKQLKRKIYRDERIDKWVDERVGARTDAQTDEQRDVAIDAAIQSLNEEVIANA
ncbi:hypothetical protein BDD12DRAFT_893342 [Trichophaea hybrida]|nr:hypothetical protein BDD12DRAFT_893342 [Trichophaea hybrida]